MYYNAEMHKILPSHNYPHINPPPEMPPEMPPVLIIITPSPQHEGEPEISDMPLLGVNDSDGARISLANESGKGEKKRCQSM
jgi:hypothetical protein